jgi:hypothetical protein
MSIGALSALAPIASFIGSFLVNPGRNPLVPLPVDPTGYLAAVAAAAYIAGATRRNITFLRNEDRTTLIALRQGLDNLLYLVTIAGFGVAAADIIGGFRFNAFASLSTSNLLVTTCVVNAVVGTLKWANDRPLWTITPRASLLTILAALSSLIDILAHRSSTSHDIHRVYSYANGIVLWMCLAYAVWTIYQYYRHQGFANRRIRRELLSAPEAGPQDGS